MTRPEFAGCIAFITAATGKQLSDDALEVYFQLLGDLPLSVFQVSCERVVLEHKWATFPTVAELREAAAETMQGSVKQMSAAEAWDLAWDSAKRIDLEIEGSLQRATKDMPPLVLEAMKAFGIPPLVYGKDPVGVIRGQFMNIFEQLAARERRQSLLPKRVLDAIANKGCPRLGDVVKGIGRMPEESLP